LREEYREVSDGPASMIEKLRFYDEPEVEIAQEEEEEGLQVRGRILAF
jgi:hypothetical protein